MKFATDRPFADPEKAARRILKIAHAVEPVQGRINIEKINEPFLFRDRGSPAEYGAGLKLRGHGPYSAPIVPSRNESRGPLRASRRFAAPLTTSALPSTADITH
jgi:hypothetical protein